MLIYLCDVSSNRRAQTLETFQRYDIFTAGFAALYSPNIIDGRIATVLSLAVTHNMTRTVEVNGLGQAILLYNRNLILPVRNLGVNWRFQPLFAHKFSTYE